MMKTGRARFISAQSHDTYATCDIRRHMLACTSSSCSSSCTWYQRTREASTHRAVISHPRGPSCTPSCTPSCAQMTKKSLERKTAGTLMKTKDNLIYMQSKSQTPMHKSVCFVWLLHPSNPTCNPYTCPEVYQTAEDPFVNACSCPKPSIHALITPYNRNLACLATSTVLTNACI